MKKRILALFNLILFTCAGCMAADEAAGNTEAEAEADGVAEKLIKRARQNKVWPLTSDLVPGLDLAGAYAIQRSLVAANLPGDKISGFKAALTTGSAQGAFWPKKGRSGRFARFHAALWHDGPRFGAFLSSDVGVGGRLRGGEKDRPAT